ncbi:MAG: hypothetical protein PWQ82_1413, partial [Thermosediminibacterales bacterium]|nr:hypothetical protein [Thermosediminibacterales bacterium]
AGFAGVITASSGKTLFLKNLSRRCSFIPALVFLKVAHMYFDKHRLMVVESIGYVTCRIFEKH